jgi:S-adenosyl-L-methionine hydrolase (adenosine-forming)
MDPTGIARLALVTDFGPGVYLGQMRGRLSELVPHLPVIDLVQDLPPFRADLAAYLLPALIRDMPRGTLYLCVVDPGVGGARSMLLVESDGDWLLGPDNGLLSRVAHRGREVRAFRIGWRPQSLSASFHGRDWIAPAAARLCQDQPLGLRSLERRDLVGSDWADEWPAVIYGDRYGNLMCGLRAAAPPLGPHTRIRVAGRLLGRARTFCEVPVGEPFWYENALGLVEIAVNRGRADRLLGLTPGDAIEPLGDGESEVVCV